MAGSEVRKDACGALQGEDVVLLTNPLRARCGSSNRGAGVPYGEDRRTTRRRSLAMSSPTSAACGVLIGRPMGRLFVCGGCPVASPTNPPLPANVHLVSRRLRHLDPPLCSYLARGRCPSVPLGKLTASPAAGRRVRAGCAGLTRLRGGLVGLASLTARSALRTGSLPTALKAVARLRRAHFLFAASTPPLDPSVDRCGRRFAPAKPSGRLCEAEQCGDPAGGVPGGCMPMPACISRIPAGLPRQWLCALLRSFGLAFGSALTRPLAAGESM